MALNYKKDKQTFGLKLSPYIIFLKQHLFPTASQIICQQKKQTITTKSGNQNDCRTLPIE